MIIEGAISVKSALLGLNRDVYKIYIDKSKKTKDFNYLRKLIKSKNISLIELDRKELDKIASSKTYGGILAEVSSRKSNDLEKGDIFLVDGVEDPFNLGYIMRNLYAFGIKNIILAKKDYSFCEAQILKSSAGAYDFMNVCFEDDFVNIVKDLKKNHKVYALKRSDDSKDIFDEYFSQDSLFLLGGEKRGITSELELLADTYLYIPYGSDFRNALNACNACAVCATLLYSQRK